MGCSESYGALIKVEAIKDADIIYKYPMQRFSKMISKDDEISIPEDASKRMVLFADEMSASYKDDNDTNVAESKHAVSITYDMHSERARLPEEDAQVRALHNGWFHLLLTFYGDNQAIVRCSDKYHFSFSEVKESDVSKCSITIQNISGIQFIL